MAITTVLKLIDPLIIARIIDFSVPNNDLRDMFNYGTLFIVVILLCGLLNYLQIIWMAKLGVRIVTKLKFKVFNHLLYLPIKWFDKTPTGELLSRVESDCQRVTELFSNFSVSVLGNLLFFIGMFSVL